MSCGNAILSLLLSEFLLSGHASGIRKVAVKCEKHVLYLRIDRVMKTFDRIGAGRNAIEGVIHLRKIVKIEGEMPFREMSWPETEFASGDAVADDEAATFQMLEI